MRNFILIDLDDTVCSTAHRQDLLPDWDAFQADAINDDPIEDMVNLIRSLNTMFYFIGITGRNKRYWPVTLAWLTSKQVPIEKVLMRADDDYRPTPEVKVALAAEFFGGEDKIKDYVAFFIDDTESCIAAFAAIGVAGLHYQKS